LGFSYVKVAEFQRRGLVHFHLVARLDGPEGPQGPPPAWATGQILVEALRATVRSVTVARVGGGERLAWGHELDVRAIGEDAEGPADPAEVAAYLAKYSTKGSESSGALGRRLRSPTDPAIGRLRPHPARLVEAAWQLGGDGALAPLHLRAHAHTFGFPGHFATKSARYSTTFRALRAARAAHRGEGHEVAADFGYAGRGYADARASQLAEALGEATKTSRRTPAPRVPRTSPPLPRDVPTPGDQG
jgi:hypothetical protein